MQHVQNLIDAIEEHRASLASLTYHEAHFRETRRRVVVALTQCFHQGPAGLSEAGMLAIEIVELAMKLPPQPGDTNVAWGNGTALVVPPFSMLNEAACILRRALAGEEPGLTWPAEHAAEVNAARYPDRGDALRPALEQVVVRRE